MRNKSLQENKLTFKVSISLKNWLFICLKNSGFAPKEEIYFVGTIKRSAKDGCLGC